MGVRIRGILAVVPPGVRTTEDLAARFGRADAERVAQLTGVTQARVVSPGQTSGDLAVAAGCRLLSRLQVAPADVDGVILVTQTPDFLMPATACILQDRLGLAKQSLAFDVNLGCSAYPYGLAICSGLLAAGLARRILLFVGDTSSLRVHPDDKASAPLFGDSMTATLLESDPSAGDILGTDLGTDGAGWHNLVVPVGQCRYRTLDEFRAGASTRVKNVAYPDKLYMNGQEIFTFTLREVPGIIERTLRHANLDARDVDYFFFHQANKFMLDHLIRKMGFSTDKCPFSIHCYGNTSGASPALTACHAVSEVNRDRELRAMFVGFGIGYSWGGALVRLRPGTVFPIESLENGASPTSGLLCE